MIAEIDLSTEQKHHIAFAIDELEAISNRSLVEEITLNVLKAILPERLPSPTKLMANYPNPFNPETWVPLQLSQDAEVTVTIYEVIGQVVRQIELDRPDSRHYSQVEKAVCWDGKTETGESAASGTYLSDLCWGLY